MWELGFGCNTLASDFISDERLHDVGTDIGMAPSASNNEVEILAGRMPDEQYKQLVRTLNLKQREIFTHIFHHIKTRNNPLAVFITGGAGVGKSVVLRTLYQTLHRHFGSLPGKDPEDCCILVTAFTGLAAYNVSGSTLHSALKIPVYSGKKGKQIVPKTKF